MGIEPFVHMFSTNLPTSVKKESGVCPEVDAGVRMFILFCATLCFGLSGLVSDTSSWIKPVSTSSVKWTQPGNERGCLFSTLIAYGEKQKLDPPLCLAQPLSTLELVSLPLGESAPHSSSGTSSTTHSTQVDDFVLGTFRQLQRSPYQRILARYLGFWHLEQRNPQTSKPHM